MKRAKKYHLGESLQDIIKKQEDTDGNELYFNEKTVEPAQKPLSDNQQSVMNGTMHDKKKVVRDIMTGEEFTEDEDDDDALTIVEDLVEATKKILGEDHPAIESAHAKKPIDLNKDIILNEIQFNSFYFYEREDRFEIIIPKKPAEPAKFSLENAFLEIITEISDVEQFI